MMDQSKCKGMLASVLLCFTGAAVAESVEIVDFGAKLGSGFYRGGLASYYTAHVDRENDGSLTNDFVHSWAFSETDPLNPDGLDFDTNSLNGTFYGGLTLYTSSDLGPRGMSEGHMNQNHEFKDDLNLMTLPAPRSNEMVEAYAVYYWPKEGFLNGGSDYTVTFDTNSQIGVDITRYWGGVNAGRWLVRDGDQFYLSEDTFAGETQQFYLGMSSGEDGANNPVARKTHILNPTTSRWAPYTPAVSNAYEIDFDSSAATFTNRTFTNVTAIGFFVERQLSPAVACAASLTVGEPISVKWGSIRAEAVVNKPATPSYNMDMGSIASGAAISSNEVSYELWRKVFRFAQRRQHARDMGLITYSFEKDGAMGTMRADNLPHTGEEPVTDITWYDAIAWCNALSQFEGLEPCYTTDATHTNILSLVVARDKIETWTNRPTVYWNTNAAGFRLPTPAEWSQQTAGMKSTSSWEYVWFPSGAVADPATETNRTVLGWGLATPTQSILQFSEHPWEGSPRITLRPLRNNGAAPLFGAASGATEWNFTAETALPPTNVLSAYETRAVVTQFLDEVTLNAGLADTNQAADLGFDPFEALDTSSPYSVEFGATEIPYRLWNFVQQWAVDNGYSFNYSGDMGSMGNSPDSTAFDPDEPVTEISWYDAIVWCNALSEIMEREPVYWQDAAFSNVWKQANEFRLETFLGDRYPNWPNEVATPYDTASYIPVYMKVAANGYRLPLPQEWDLANITDANSGTADYNWTSLNASGKTHRVGTRLPNPIGLYDMEGNVRELTWGDSRANINNVMHRKGSHFARGYQQSHPVLDIYELPSVGRAHVGFRTMRSDMADPDYTDFIASPGALTIAENGSALLSIRLKALPAGTVTVAVTRISGDSDIGLSGANVLLFDSTNWSTQQTVTVYAADDTDHSDDAAVLRISADELDPLDVNVSGTDDDTQTIVSLSTNVLRSGVERFGINLDENYWQSPILKKRAAYNFEGILYRQCHQGELYTNGFITYWCSTNTLAQTGWDDVYTNGGVFRILSGEAAGTTGRITRIETRSVDIYNNGTVTDQPFLVFDTPLTLSSNGVRNAGLLISDFTRSEQGYLGENNAYWKTAGTTVITSDHAPGSFGTACARLDAGSNATVRLPTHHQRAADANGDWRIRFYARSESGSPVLTVDGDSYVTGTNINLTGEWQLFDLTLTAAGIPTPDYPASDKLLTFSLAASGNGAVLIDDIELWKEGQTNSTPFTDEALSVLRRLNPGVIRFLRMGGGTVTNAILPQLQQFGVSFGEYEPVGVYSGTDGNYRKSRISIHEQAQLCEELGANPWFNLPGGIEPAEVSLFVDYLAGSTNTPGGRLRADLGHPQPWSEVFDRVYVEFGNEAWNTAVSYKLSGFNGADYWHDLIADGKNASSYTNNILFTAAGQNFLSGMADSILSDATNADRYAIAPYMIHSVTDDDLSYFQSPLKEFEWFMAYPLFKIFDDGLPQQGAVMDARGTPYSIYEYNYHFTSGDASTQSNRNRFAVSAAHGVSIANTMLAMLETYGIGPQCFFTLNQFDYEGTRLWGSVISAREDSTRVRPVFHALEAVNQVIQGDLVETSRGGDNPAVSVTGLFDSDSPLTLSRDKIFTYAFRDGTTNGLILINYDLAVAQQVQMDLPFNVAGQTAQRWTLTSVNFDDNNEPELASPQVSLTQDTLTNFSHAALLSIPPASVMALQWVESDEIPKLVLSTNRLQVAEGETSELTVALSAPSAGPIAFSLSISEEESADFELTQGGPVMTFTAANWNVPQTATVYAAEDPFGIDGSGQLSFAATGYVDTQVTLRETDDDPAGNLGLGGAVHFDFGSSKSGYITTGSGWNNVTSLATGTPIANAVDTNGVPSGISLVITQAFQYVMTDSTAAHPDYPTSVQRDYFRVLSTQPEAAFKLTGLSSAYEYTLLILASGGQDFGSETRFTVNGTEKVIDSYHNSELLEFTNIVPNASDEIIVNMDNNGEGMGALNLIQLNYSTPYEPEDTDADVLPDWWEDLHGYGQTGAVATNIAANGINTLLECYIAGINPADANSKFMIQNIIPLQWNAVSGRAYTIYWTSNLLHGFQPLETNLTSGSFTDLLHGAEDSGFYKIEVELSE